MHAHVRSTMAGIKEWVSERLHEILGLSDRQVAEFMIELARKSRNAGELTRKLQNSGTFQVSPEVERFAAELWNKCLGGTSSERKSTAGIPGSDLVSDEYPRSTKRSRNIRSQRETELESDEEDDRPPSGGDDSDSDEWERFAVVNS